jgi:hypothetical protein
MHPCRSGGPKCRCSVGECLRRCYVHRTFCPHHALEQEEGPRLVYTGVGSELIKLTSDDERARTYNLNCFSGFRTGVIPIPQLLADGPHSDVDGLLGLSHQQCRLMMFDLSEYQRANSTARFK